MGLIGFLGEGCFFSIDFDLYTFFFIIIYYIYIIMAKGVLRMGEQTKGLTNIGQVNYITQMKTNVVRSKQDGQVIVAKNFPYIRRFS